MHVNSCDTGDCIQDGPIEYGPTAKMPVCPKKRKCRNYIEVDRNASKSCFSFVNLSGVKKTNWQERVRFNIYRRGNPSVFVSYDAWDLSDNGDVCVMWDDTFLDACAGLYEVEVMVDCKPCGFLCLQLKGCKIESTSATHVLDYVRSCSPCAGCGNAPDACTCTCGVVPELMTYEVPSTEEGVCDGC